MRWLVSGPHQTIHSHCSLQWPHLSARGKGLKVALDRRRWSDAERRLSQMALGALKNLSVLHWLARVGPMVIGPRASPHMLGYSLAPAMTSLNGRVTRQLLWSIRPVPYGPMPPISVQSVLNG